MEDLLTEAIDGLSGLSHCAGLVVAPKHDTPLRHIEFVGLSPTRVLAVLVNEDGQVENRVLETPGGWTPSSLVEATNYVNSTLARPHLCRTASRTQRRTATAARTT